MPWQMPTNYTGTHLILPPCVSLCGQNINRFASPKNIRFMNSMRESCRSIEELDLGGNKLIDLIEVYKILQCTPNLRFLNLSENDLSRTSPVAMANTTTTTTTTTNCPSSIYSPSSTPLQQFNSNSQSASFNQQHANPYAPTIAPGASSYTVANNNVQQQSGQSGNWLNSNSTLSNQRTCLAPINQNQSHNHSIGGRRHSSLGQPSTSSACLKTSTSAKNPYQRNLHRPGAVSRVAEARLLAATSAVAQSKKTSSTVASKLTNSATAAHKCSSHRNESNQSKSNSAQQDSDLSSLKAAKGKRCLSGTTSTMQLARSLSSLSAKDARGVNSSLGRLSVHRSNVCRNKVEKTGPLGVKKCQVSTDQRDRRSSLSSEPTAFQSSGADGPKIAETQSSLDMSQATSLESKFDRRVTKLTTSVSSGKLYVEPIVETDDIDMSDQQHPQQAVSATKQQNVSTGVSQTSSSLGTANTSTSGQSTTSVANPRAQYNTTKTSQVTSYTFGGGSGGGGQSTNFRRTFISIKGLALNNTGCQWRVVCSILSRMPNLEELHLSLNNYERIDLDPNEFKHYSLKRLYLCNNPKLTNWEELDKLLSAFPSLEALSIADCNISQIPENLGRSREWRKLCGLNINGWPIKEWPVIERLNQLPSLVDLRCRNLEILSTIDEPRHHLIARLPKLQRLNGSEIEEREHAEKAFLRFYMTNSHLERPARFHELIQIHGEVGPIDVDVDLSPPSHAHVRVIYLNRNHYRKDNEDDILMSEDFLIKLMETVEPNNIVVQGNSNSDNSLQENMDIGETSPREPLRLFKDEGQEVIAIDVDLRQSVRKFKSTLASLFGLVNQDLIIYYIDHEMVGLMGPEEIKHNQKKLWNYNVQDGDQFIVEER